MIDGKIEGLWGSMSWVGTGQGVGLGNQTEESKVGGPQLGRQRMARETLLIVWTVRVQWVLPRERE